MKETQRVIERSKRQRRAKKKRVREREYLYIVP